MLPELAHPGPAPGVGEAGTKVDAARVAARAQRHDAAEDIAAAGHTRAMRTRVHVAALPADAVVDAFGTARGA
ncbi:hypothetical protein CLD22_11550 [Rubrivivax gelatinosus]|nr:hypothetical protein [Rubrivivax gelatinosus]